MDINLFDFHLPEELIAQVPLEERETSRLMVLDRETGILSINILRTFFLTYMRGLLSFK